MVNIFTVYCICDSCKYDGEDLSCVIGSPFILGGNDESDLLRAKSIKNGSYASKLPMICPYPRVGRSVEPRWRAITSVEMTNYLAALESKNCVTSDGKITVLHGSGSPRENTNRFANIDVV